MKSNAQNVCKFVTNQTDKQLTTINFVLEQNAANDGVELLRAHDTIHLMVSGTGRLHMDGKTMELTPGTLFSSFTGVPFMIENVDSMVYLYISFRGRRTASLYEKAGISRDNCVFPGYSGLTSFWKNALVRATDQNLELISESVLLYTFSQMTETDGQLREDLVNSVIHLIETEFTDSTFTLEVCAEKLGYNSKYISRIFKQSVGVTFSEYLRDMRIKHAVFLIEQGVSIVKNVAFLSGYSDSLYFSNVFRQVVGTTPSQYIASVEKTKK